MATAGRDAAPIRLGFGCSNLGSDLGYRESCALVEAAYECGFRHFDVAPSYGHGQAEKIVGDVLSAARDSVTLVTKSGIAHPRAVGGFRLARKIFLPLKKAFPSLWSSAARQANQTVATRGRFGRHDIEASVAESLRRLRTDRLDALLMHEVQPDDVGDELLDTLRDLQSRRVASIVGLGTGVDASARIVQSRPAAFGWVQVNHHWGAFTPALRAPTRRLVTHRWLKTGSRLLQTPVLQGALGADPAAGALRAALADPSRAPLLLLAAALRRNAEGTLLVSSSKTVRLREYAAAARSAGQGADLLADLLNAHFERVVERIPSPDL